jgi:hypothetical protein
MHADSSPVSGKEEAPMTCNDGSWTDSGLVCGGMSLKHARFNMCIFYRRLYVHAATCPMYSLYAIAYDPGMNFGLDDSCYRAFNSEAYLANDYVMIMCDGSCHPVGRV